MTPLAEKQQQRYICLCSQGEDPTEEENIFELCLAQVNRVPILYNECFRITLDQMNPNLSNIVLGFMKCILREIGLELFQKVILELRIPPRP